MLEERIVTIFMFAGYRDTTSLAQHNDCKQVETASLALS